MRMGFRTTFTVSAALLLASIPAGAPQEFAHRDVPLYDLSLPRHTAQVRVDVREYGSPIDRNVLGVLADAGDELGEAERMLASYLQLVREGALDDALDLYLAQDQKARLEARQMSEFLERALAKVDSIGFEKTLFFGRFQMTFVDFFRSDGTVRKFTLGMVTENGNYYRSDDWGASSAVAEIFYFMAGNERRGLAGRHAARFLAESLTIPGLDVGGQPVEDHPLVVSVDGQVYPHTEDWTAPEEYGSSSSVASSARRFLTSASEGSNEEFLVLWNGSGKERMEKLLESDRDSFEGIKNHFAKNTPIKHVLSVVLGNYRAHYYLAQNAGSELQVLIFKDVEGELLFDEELYSNVATLIRSKLLREQVLKRWEASKKKDRARSHR